MIAIKKDFPKKSVLALVVLGAVSLILAPGLLWLETRNSCENELSGNDPLIRQNRRLESIFGKRDELVIVVCAADVLQPATLSKLASLTDRIKELRGVAPEDVKSLSTVYHIGLSGGRIQSGLLLREIPETELEVEQLRREIDGDHLISGHLVSRDYTRCLIQARLDEDGEPSVITRQAKAIILGYAGPEEIYLLGDPIIGAEVDRAIGGQLKILFPLAFGLIMLLLLAYSRSVYFVLLSAAAALLSEVWTFGLAGYLGLPLSVVSSAIPVLLVVAAGSYGVQALPGFQSCAVSGAPWKNPARRVVNGLRDPLLAGSATLALAAAALSVYKIKSIREFGVLLAAGVLSAALLYLVFVPAVLALLPPKTRPGRLGLESAGNFNEKLKRLFVEFPLGRGRAFFLAAAVALLAALLGGSRLKVGMDPLDYFGPGFSFTRNLNDYESHFGGARKMYVMVEGATQNIQNPELLQKIDSFQRDAQHAEQVGGSFSLGDVIKRINLVLHENNYWYDRIPDSEDKVARLARLYATSGAPENLESVVSPDSRKTKITLNVRPSDVENQTRLYSQLASAGKDIFGAQGQLSFGGRTIVGIALFRNVIAGNLLNVFLTLGLLTGIAAWVLRSLRFGLLAVVPVAAAVIINFGMMGYTGIKLNLATAVITAVGAGIGLNISIRYLLRVKARWDGGLGMRKAIEATVQLSGRAILVDLAVNLCGFAVFIFSPLEPVREFGGLLCLSVLVSGAGALLLLPAGLCFLEEDRRTVQEFKIRPELLTNVRVDGQTSVRAALRTRSGSVQDGMLPRSLLEQGK